jgi:hypothetical protein
VRPQSTGISPIAINATYLYTSIINNYNRTGVRLPLGLLPVKSSVAAMSPSEIKVSCTRPRASRKASALVALPMGHQVANAVVDCGSPPNNGSALVALPFGGQVGNAVIIPRR